jgi:serine/threonine protein phosphatase PrpC
MAGKLAFRSVAASHVGHVRKLNEDGVLARPEIGLWAVADGMGGYGGGDIASGAVVTALGQLPKPVSAAAFLRDFEAKIAGVNTQLRALARGRSGSLIGTTLVAVLIFDAHFACVWCGDSRAYLLRDGVLTQISRDHSEVQDLVDRGVLAVEEAKTWPGRNVVTRALGATNDADLEIIDGPTVAGDRFLLCSDGLMAHVSDAEIAEKIARQPPQKACDDLIALTLQRGAADNVSIVIVDCEQDEQTVIADRV